MKPVKPILAALAVAIAAGAAAPLCFTVGMTRAIRRAMLTGAGPALDCPKLAKVEMMGGKDLLNYTQFLGCHRLHEILVSDPSSGETVPFVPIYLQRVHPASGPAPV